MDSLPQKNQRILWERCLPAIGATRFVSNTASSFIAGKPRANGCRLICVNSFAIREWIRYHGFGDLLWE